MKYFKLILSICFFAAMFSGCASDSKTTTTVVAQPGTPATPKVVSGNFKGDGKTEAITLVKPQLNADGTACIDSNCTAYIKFSDTTMHPIAVKHCIGGEPENLGDLNGDGSDEIGLLPDWFTSCWRDYYVFTYKNGEWLNAVPPIRTHCNQWDAHIKPIEKDSLNKGYVIVRYSEFENNEIVNKSKIIAIK